MNIAAFWALQIGMLTTGGFSSGDHYSFYPENSMYANISIELEFEEIFYIKGEIESLFYPHKSQIAFWPYHDKYTVEFGLQYDIFTLGFRHMCGHPVLPNERRVMVFDENREEIFLLLTNR